jgi:hypothetical protein
MLSLLGLEKCASSVEIEQLAIHFPLVKVTAWRLEPDCGSDAPAFSGSKPAARINRSAAAAATLSSVA